MLDLEVATESPVVAPGATANLHLVATVKSGTPPLAEPRAPGSTVFALDCSGSMGGDPIRHLISSMERLLDLLPEGDRFGIVAFSNGARVVFPLTAADPASRAAAKRAVRGMRALASTAVEAALRTSREVLGERGLHERQAILLLTDGLPNVGASTAEALAAVAASMRPGVGVSTLGFGPAHDVDVLQAIAAAGGGTYGYIPDPALCQLELARALGARADIVADGLELHVAPSEGVRISGAIGAGQLAFAFDGLVLPLPPMPGSSSRSVALALAFDAGGEPGRRKLAEVRLTYRRPGEKQVATLSAALAVTVARGASGPDIPALHTLLVLRAEAARNEARALADRGDFAGAAVLLERLAAEIQGAPSYAAGDGSPLSEAYEQLVDDAALMRMRPDEATYRSYKRSQRGPGDMDPGVPQSVDSRFLVDSSAGKFPKASLRAIGGPLAGHTFELRARNVLGRTRSTDICIPSSGVSRQHAKVFASAGEFWIACLGSSNGTYVNGAKITTHKLALHDRVDVGESSFVYEEDLP